MENFDDILKEVFSYKSSPKIIHLTVEMYSKLTGFTLKHAKKSLEEHGTPLEYKGWYEITLQAH